MLNMVFRRHSADILAKMRAANICIVKPSALGDIVQSLVLLPVLRERFPEARLTWVVKSQFADLLRNHPLLDEVLAIDMRGGWRCWERLLGEVRRCQFDLLFDLQGLMRTALITWVSGAPVRVGLETAREGAPWSTNCHIPGTSKDVPAHARYWRIAECLGMGSACQTTVLGISEHERRWAGHAVGSSNGSVVAIHPGAAWTTKQWPPEKFASLAQRVHHLLGASILLVGAAKEQALADRIERRLRDESPDFPVQNLVGTTSLKQLAALLARVDSLISNDSGPMHLAAGMGTPVLGIFTCTNPRRSGPLGEQHEFVATSVACAGCYRKVCPRRGRQHLACLEELTVERVWTAFERLVQKNRLDSPNVPPRRYLV
jgi:lipopolysaccharide heptosyltransferase I